jgi:hypothetical protein
MGAFASGIGASLIAGTILWGVTHRDEVGFLVSARRRRAQVRGSWHSYHLSRDSLASPRPIWVEHRDDIRVDLFGRLHGRSRAQYGKEMTYRIFGAIRGPALRVYLKNQDVHEAPASVLYPNLLGGDVLVGIIVGEDFDRQWYASPSVMSKQPLSQERLTALTRNLRINRPPQRRRATDVVDG